MRLARVPSLLLAVSAALLCGAGVAALPAAEPARRATAADAPAVLVLPATVTEPVPVLAVPVAAAPAAVPAAVDRRPEVRRPAPASRARGPVLTPQQRGVRALAALDYPWRSLGYDVVFRPYTGRRLGHADPRTRTLTVYVKPDQDETELRTTIAHELGHALDFEHGTPERRREYLRLRGISPRAWYPCAGCDDLSTPAGDWAEVFAAALVGTDDFRSRVAGAPTAEELRRIAPLFTVPARPADPPRRDAQPAADERADEEAEEEEEEDGGLLPLGARRTRLL